jgi:cytochrome c oxidase subunit 3
MRLQKHLFHLVEPSPWPLFSAFGALFFTSGFAFYMHRLEYSGYVLLLSLIIILLSAFFWFRDIINESTYIGFHSLVVRKGLKNGFLAFIASEIMLFFGFFWAFFHSSVCPSIFLGSEWPPVGIITIPTYGYPLFNTALLIISGFSIT